MKPIRKSCRRNAQAMPVQCKDSSINAWLNSAIRLVVIVGGCFGLSLCMNPAYSVDLSKSTSVTPERHSGFFVPVSWSDAQSNQDRSARPAAALRLQSVYDGWTSQNKSVMANMRGGSCRPRVTPVTLSDSQADWVKSQNLQGVRP